MYDHSAGPKSDFTYIKGIESHLIRRKMILTKYPQIAKLLVPDKPWTIIIAFGVILLSMANCYWARVLLALCRTTTSGCCCSTPIWSEDCSTIRSTAASMTSRTSEDIAT